MASRDFGIKKIQDQSIKVNGMNGTLKFNNSMSGNINSTLQQTQNFIDSEVLRCCKPLVPFLNGVLVKSGDLNTDVGSGLVQYKTPYARKQYYQGNSKGLRGRMWFERMKSSNKKQILSGAQKIINGGG